MTFRTVPGSGPSPTRRVDREGTLNPVWEPAEDVLPAVVGMGLSLFRTGGIAMVLDRAQVYPDGCRLWVMIAVRGAGEGAEGVRFVDPADLGSPADDVPDDLVRFGVHYPDGAAATTVGAGTGRAGSKPGSRTGTDPQLVLRLDGADGRQQHSEAWYELLLWPLPPATTFELVTEWPVQGVPPTRSALDGAAIRQAASRVEPLWPDATSPP